MIDTATFAEVLNTMELIDRQWLISINHGLVNPWLDRLMWLISSRGLWIGLAVGWLIWSLVARRPRLAKQIIFAAAVLGLSDFLAARFLKPHFERPRPCHALSYVRIVDGCAGYNGFPSNHAVNGMAVATVMVMVQGFKVGLAFLAIALSVGFSRIYLGVHYPGDILAGFAFGSVVAILALFLGRRVWQFLR
jgi:undecaprenyl-diphosphatase